MKTTSSQKPNQLGPAQSHKEHSKVLAPVIRFAVSVNRGGCAWFPSVPTVVVMFVACLTLALFSLFNALGDTNGAMAGSEKHWSAPDNSMVAVAANSKPDQSADRLNWDVVTIRDRHHQVVASLSLEQGSGITHSVVDDAVWSPDSRFFCFETASSGGHSAWHQPTYVFDAKTLRIYSVDDTIGAITSDNSRLHFNRGDVLQVDLYNFNQEKNSDSFCFSKDLDLPAFVKQAKVAVHSSRAAEKG